jgi:hypothetical protein
MHDGYRSRTTPLRTPYHLTVCGSKAIIPIPRAIKADFSALQTVWRRGRDSNPRYPFRYAGFQDRCHQPLGHLSVYYSFTIGTILAENRASGSEVAGRGRAALHRSDRSLAIDHFVPFGYTSILLASPVFRRAMALEKSFIGMRSVITGWRSRRPLLSSAVIWYQVWYIRRPLMP